MNRPMLIVFASIALQSALQADDTVKLQLDRTIATFDKATIKSKADLVSRIESEATKAQRAGDLAKLQTIRREKSAFTTTGVLPSCVSTRTYGRQMANARRRMVDAYSDAVRAYTQAGNITAAESAQKHLAAFIKAQSDPPLLFNGRNFDGWIGSSKVWKVVNGMIVGTQIPNAKTNTCLYTSQPHGDFELRCKLKLIGDHPNSGIQIRSEIVDSETFRLRGPQCDAGGDQWGSLWGELSGGMIREAPKDVVRRNLKPADFNEIVIRCVGAHVTVSLNGDTTVDADVPDMPESGVIGFQLHRSKGQPFQVVIKGLEYKSL